MKKGTKLSKEHKAKLREVCTPPSRKGAKHSAESIAKMSKAHTNPSSETRAKMSASHKGLRRSKEHCANISAGLTGKKRGERSEEWKAKLSASCKGRTSPMKGKHHTESSKAKLSKSLKGLLTGEKHPNWLGGTSFEPYLPDFNDQLKEEIRKRDNYTCRMCGTIEKELNTKLHVHHIDYDKQNNATENLISLCISCHMKTNGRRIFWQGFILGRIISRSRLE